jgi:hypothetical protein
MLSGNQNVGKFKLSSRSLTQEARVSFCLPRHGRPERPFSHGVDRPVLLFCGSKFPSLHLGFRRLSLHKSLQCHPQTFCKQNYLRIDRNPRAWLTGERGGQGIVLPQTIHLPGYSSSRNVRVQTLSAGAKSCRKLTNGWNSSSCGTCKRSGMSRKTRPEVLLLRTKNWPVTLRCMSPHKLFELRSIFTRRNICFGYHVMNFANKNRTLWTFCIKCT